MNYLIKFFFYIVLIYIHKANLTFIKLSLQGCGLIFIAYSLFEIFLLCNIKQVLMNSRATRNSCTSMGQFPLYFLANLLQIVFAIYQQGIYPLIKSSCKLATEVIPRNSLTNLIHLSHNSFTKSCAQMQTIPSLFI